MPQYRLHYFNFKGRGEVVRLMFKVAGVEFEDLRFEREDWPKHKENMPFGQVPVLEVDGKMLAQTNAICRFLANEFKLTGNDKWEAAQADAIADTIGDTMAPLRAIVWEQDEEKKKEMGVKYVADTLRPFLRHLEKLFQARGSEYLVGKDLTWIDIAFFSYMDACVSRFGDDLFNETPGLKGVFEKVGNIPAIKNWVETRPQTAI